MEQAAVQDPLIGHSIGNYVVKSKLGEGGMGAVYLAEHPLIGKKVALKVLHPELSSNEDITTRFFHEAKAVNDIQHPNIVDILDYGVIPNNGQKTVYFFMEFLEGQSLAQVIRNQAPMPPERALAIGLQIADALGASHRQEIVHRDLKPDNVILLQRGRTQDFVKVLDFGIAKLTGDQPGSRRTRTGIVMGTPAYMSPEQCEGKGDVDHRTDIYALGILLYEMLTGQVPFQGEGSGEVLVKHLTQPPARPSVITPMIPPHVEAVVLKALEKDPEARYPSMDEFMRGLADPVGYVDSHGGLAGFAAGGPTSSASGPYTPPPGQIASPVPGQVSPQIASPVPGQVPHRYTPGPGTLQVPGSSTVPPGTDKSGGSGKRVAVIAVAAAVAAVLGVGAYALLSGTSGDSDSRAVAGTTGSDPATSQATSGDPEPAGNKSGTATAQDEAPDPGAEQDTEAAVQDPGEAAAEPPGGPEEPALISVSLTSAPKGAEVYVNDEDEPRGTTPLDLELEKSPDEVTLTIKRDRHEVETRIFVPDKDKDFHVELDRERRNRKRSSRNRRSKRDREDRRGKKGKKSKKSDKDSGDNTEIDKDVGLMSPEW